ncbi:nicotinate-nucleotide--dimethylbenzimidazole phosphoribosyltransferase [Anaerosporobacter sp.]|uniref:nicotinate-nucleotide--dimethylbenzimidazole phosphoribosyltransferase n=1 Tax=Anaerosporobacter sp. TaxID=1872529 RepID=UPI00286F95B7|nr:nicotinate-nucleotide--dimethylbenzimidazole phosphoribosyltransferase [Anaerosporobacter sp.]
MLEESLWKKIKEIKPRDEIAIENARNHWLNIAKPLFSLGKLEKAVIDIAGMKGTCDYKLDKRGLLIFCADNGVVAEGVTQTGQEVTAIVSDNFSKGNTSVCKMAQIAKADVMPIDIGIAVDVPSITKKELKVAYGTKNMTKEAAMTREEAVKAILIGIDAVKQCKETGYEILATGEMGIGNTTTSSAVASVLLHKPVELVTGKGAGLTNEGLERKVQAIKKAIEINKPDANDAIDVLLKVGGLDIAGIVGAFLGGALYQIPIVIDGFICAVAALIAARINTFARDYMIPSHVSKEPAGKMVLKELGLEPYITCDMCLGEGTGAVVVLPLLDMGLAVYREMNTFADINIDNYEVFDK